MNRPFIALMLAAAVALSGCSRAPKAWSPPPGDLVSLESLPAAYGELVSATFAPQQNGQTLWRELWFQNEATGQVTYVPVVLPDWKYYPKMVRTFVRPDWQAPPAATP